MTGVTVCLDLVFIKLTTQRWQGVYERKVEKKGKEQRNWE